MSMIRRIELLCNEQDTTFAALERECGLSNGSIRRWDTNTPSTDKLQKVSEYFNVSTDYLIGKVPFRNTDEALTSISIASVKYVMNNRDDFDTYFANGSMDYYYDSLYDSNLRLFNYIDRLVRMYENKDNAMSNLEYFELANILFADIKYNDKNYDGLIYLVDFYGGNGVVKLDFDEIPRYTKHSIDFDKSLMHKLRNPREEDYITHSSLLIDINTNNANKVEIGETNQIFSYEALDVAKAYDSATIDKKTIVKLTLGISSTYKENSHLIPNAAHEIKGASLEDKAHDDSMMDDDDF